MPHGVLVQVQSRAPKVVYSKSCRQGGFLLHLLLFYIAKIVDYY